MSSSIQHSQSSHPLSSSTPVIDPRKQELLEARLCGVSSASSVSVSVSSNPNGSFAVAMNTPSPATDSPNSVQKIGYVLSQYNFEPNPNNISQQTLQVLAIPSLAPEGPVNNRDDSNVSVRSTSSHSGEPAREPEVQNDVRGSTSSNSVSLMAAEPVSVAQPEPKKRKRVAKAKDTAVTTKATKLESPSTSNGPSGRKTSDASRLAVSQASVPAQGIAVPPNTQRLSPSSAPLGSQSPLHANFPTYNPTYPSTPVVHSSVMNGQPPYRNGISCQTDLSSREIQAMISRQTSDRADKDRTTQSLEQKVQESQKDIQRWKQKVELSDDRLMKCTDMEKKLLIEKSAMERKSARSKSVHNRMKLGQFVTQREGANFEEKFLDGYAFIEIHKKMDEIQAEKDELDRRRKLLQKRKPTDKGNSKRTNNALPSSASTSSLNDNETSVVGAVAAQNATPFAGNLATASGSTANGPNNWATEFVQPEAKEWTYADYTLEDEILKLRTAQLKKDEQDCQADLERTERERLLHIRELKRIFNEDQSIFKSNPVLKTRYLLLSLIGKGGFSEVHKAFDLDEQRYVAVKVHQLIKEWKDEKKDNYIKHALREYHVHRHLTHPRVVKLYDVFEIDSNSFATVLEYVEGNDLDFYLKQQKTIPEREARAIICQVVSALKYFNELKPPIIHYDLKPGNILLGHGNASGEIKVTDFGLSKVCDDEHYNSDCGMDLTSQGAGTYWYLPPEVFDTTNVPKISSKVDVWSVGVIFYQMLYGKKPYGDKQSQREVLNSLTILHAKEVEFPPKPTVSDKAKNFIRRCLTLRKDERPEVRQLVNDEYLQLGTKLTKSTTSSAERSSAVSTFSQMNSNF